MPRATLTLALLAALAAPFAVQAQQSIDPGMTQAQVVDRLGEPAAARTSGSFTYLFYKNGCAKQCGMDDIVLLENDAVVDAIFRAPERSYTGKSSSPRAIPADVAARTRPGARDVPVGDEVTQAGAPRPEAQPADSAKPNVEAQPGDSAKPTPDIRAKPIGSSPVAGTLRIPVGTKPREPGATNRKP
jgi:hypothetical protein